MRFAREGASVALPADIADEQAVEHVIAQTQHRLEPIDAAFNNAAILGAYEPIFEMTADDFDAVIATDLRGVLLLARAEIKGMIASGRQGSIVNTSSFVAEAATPGTSAYAPSKAGNLCQRTLCYHFYKPGPGPQQA